MESSLGITRRRLGGAALGGAAGLFAPAIVGRAQPTVIRVGEVESQTGPSSPYGIRSMNGVTLALEEVNKTGVVIGGTTYRIERSIGDMANDARQAVTLLRQHASDESVVCELAAGNSVGYLAIVPVAGQLKIPSICTGAGAPVKEWNPYCVRPNPVGSVALPAMLGKLVPKLGIKKLAVIYDAQQDAQHGDADGCKALAGKYGYTLAAFEAFRTGDQDFSAQIATIRGAKPDAIWVGAATGDGIRVASQIREAGLEQPMLTGYGSFQDPVYWDGTKGVVKGGYTWLAQDLQSPAPALKRFLDDYRAKFNQEATSFSTYGADAVTCLVEGLKKAGAVDREKLREALASLEITTPIGSHIRFQNPPEGNNLGAEVVVIQVTGRGAYTVV
jgi:branched-chain amino acid transport system substrate-binding protein